MKKAIVGFSDTVLRLLLSVLVLFPGYAFAGSPRIPGMNGSMIPRTAAPRPVLPDKGGPKVGIPGMYGGTVGSPKTDALPVLRQPAAAIPGVAVEDDASQNKKTIHQSEEKVIIDWESFDIGADAWVDFDQKGNPGWAALNRIWDKDPSYIFGRLTADGKIYLINQNGILFGPGSKVNVGSLTASALNIRDEDFMNNVLKFYRENGSDYPGLTSDPSAIISNHGKIHAEQGGQIFLIGPLVENNGTIKAPFGQIGLSAGTKVYLAVDPKGERMALVVDVQDLGGDGAGAAWNLEGGKLISDMGMVGMYGRMVNQDGLIRSVTAVKQGGQVELRAAERIRTGPKSVILLPIADSAETANSTFPVFRGNVYFGSLQKIGETVDGYPTLETGAPPEIIEHHGLIAAPYGEVALNAGRRVFLDEGSKVDVSGAWADLPVDKAFITLKLGSWELKDYYAQKKGILAGADITASILKNLSVADIAKALQGLENSALERNIDGGSIAITSSGDIISRKGSFLGFAGGGVNYESGSCDTTRLLSGNRIYDIAKAPLNRRYDEILGKYVKIYERFGMSDTYSGLHYGGANSLTTYVQGFTKGGQAGRLDLLAPTIVLNGRLDGSVTRGLYQNAWTQYDPTAGSAWMLSVARGLEVPRGGTLTIGQEVTQVESQDAVVKEIAVRNEKVPLGPDFDPLTSGLPGEETILSAQMLNAAKLGSISLHATTTMTTDADTRILLSPGGSFSADARRIEHAGTIIAPAGVIALSTVDNRTSLPRIDDADNPLYVPLEEMIVLARGSAMNVAGERINNSHAGWPDNGPTMPGRTGGGTISVKDKTDQGQGVFMQTGSVVDVSGGYEIDPKGKMISGSAGSLAVQGATIGLDGDLRGYAIADENGKTKGGAITLRAKDVRIVPEASSIPAEASGLVLAGDRFDDTGFTRVTLQSVGDVVIEPDTSISTSLVRLDDPIRDGTSAIGSAIAGQPDLIRLDDAMAYRSGASSFTAAAGASFEGLSTPYATGNLRSYPKVSEKVSVSKGARISTAPEGAINLSAPFVLIEGTLKSPAGTISAAATQTSDDETSLWVTKTARILAGGYSRPDPVTRPKGLPLNYRPIKGGSVSLTAGIGDLKLEGEIDISGAGPVLNRIALPDGTMKTYREAGDPGSLALAYNKGLSWDIGRVNASAGMEGMEGAALTLDFRGASTLDISAGDLRSYLTAGFDDLTLKSMKALRFGGFGDDTVKIGRKLTLDAQEISGAGGNVSLRAPWIVVKNTSINKLPTNPQFAGEGTLSLAGRWIDLLGSMQVNGFGEMRLDAIRDVTLADLFYSNDSRAEGKLVIAGDLVMKADRIYPTTLSNYTLHADGKVTILASEQHTKGPVYSAGGNLTVEAGTGIEHHGTLTAPMGTVTLRGTAPGSRIFLADGSVVTTAGNAKVKYGELDANDVWFTEDKNTSKIVPVDREHLPAKGVTLDADETVVMDGALIDVSGGGSLFAYKFRPSIEGSSDPLVKPGRYIVFRSDRLQLPGKAVYLQGGGGLSEGLYTMVDAGDPAYAFMPGAYILEIQSVSSLPGPGSFSKDGYPLVVGYSAVAGTSIRGTRPQVYSVRTAADVLKEGHFELRSLVAGAAGDVTIRGKTTIIDGLLRAAPLSRGYPGGKVSLSGEDVIVRQMTGTILGNEFGFATPVPDAQEGLLIVDARGVSGKGFREVSLGDENTTKNVTIESGSALEASIISLAAKDSIRIEAGTAERPTTLHASTTKDKGSGEGIINLTTPGILNIEDSASVRATHEIVLDVNDVGSIKGNLQVDKSAITLKSTAIFLGDDAKSTGDIGLYLTRDMLDRFEGFENLTLVSRSEIQFRSDFGLSAPRSLTLDAHKILDMRQNGASAVTINAPIINLRNSGGASSGEIPAEKTLRGSFAADAFSRINVGSGDVLFGGFDKIALHSSGDVVFVGKGSLATGNADLDISAARVTAAAGHTPDGTYQVPDFRIVAGVHKDDLNPARLITMTRPDNGDGGTTGATGGRLEFAARKIELGTTVQLDGGDIRFTTAGARNADGSFMAYAEDPDGNFSDGITLKEGGLVLARGSDAAPGGRVSLAADFLDASGAVQSGYSGKIELRKGSLIDVSAGRQGDAGTVKLKAPEQGVVINGDLKATAVDRRDEEGNVIRKGRGGSLVLDTRSIAEFSWLDEKLNDQGEVVAGGFTESLDLRARTGNIDIGAGQTLAAGSITLTADDKTAGSGQINVSGSVDAGGLVGGNIKIYAMNDLAINAGGDVTASSSMAGTAGGAVLLSSAQGMVNLAEGSMVNVSGGAGGKGGTVHLRAQRSSETGSDAKMRINGTVTGQSAVFAEAFWVYDNVSSITSAVYDNWKTKTATFMANAQAVKENILTGSSSSPWFHLLPGIEVRNSGDITLNATWDLSSKTGSIYNWRYGSAGEPGLLTLRAGRSLICNESVVDHPTSRTNLPTSNGNRDSWGLNLVAGADRGSADYLAVVQGQGDLTIKDEKMVYTESAPVNFASGRDTTIGRGQAAAPGYMISSLMYYNLASYDGSIEGSVGRDLKISGGAIQTATGDIDISVAGSLNLSKQTYKAVDTLGAIRTTGRSRSDGSLADNRKPYWDYAEGGDITLDVGGTVGMWNGTSWTTSVMSANLNQWDRAYTNSGAQVWAAAYPFGASFTMTTGLATMGGGNLRVRTGGDFLAQAGTFGRNDYGDLVVYAGGDMTGRFLNARGRMDLSAKGNFGPSVIEAFDSRVSVTSGGDIDVLAVVNPMAASFKTFKDADSSNPVQSWHIGYTKDASISLKAGGDVTYAGDSPYHDTSGIPNSPGIMAEQVMPAVLNVEAAGDIRLLNNLALLPSADGNLRLTAGGSIDGGYGDSKWAKIYVSDMDPQNVYSETAKSGVVNQLFDRETHATVPVHRKADGVKEESPIEVRASQDIRSLMLYLPKRAEITAEEGDIRDIAYYGQNVNVSDVTMIRAGKGDIIFNAAQGKENSGAVHSGPGAFFVQAGDSITLGLSKGIQLAGGGLNASLGDGKGSVVILSGYGKDMTEAGAGDFFDKLRRLIKSGEPFDQSSMKARADIVPLLGPPSGAGNILMTTSQISSVAGKDDIFIIAKGQLDVGKSTFLSEADLQATGIFTAGGGSINIFTGGDVNVNESRVMTFFGGDITVWSDYGDINAGRGAKSTINAVAPRKVADWGTNEDGDRVIIGYHMEFTPPAVGSGIRAVTYDPDGAAGHLPAPQVGDIYLQAKLIDAGEAGISGGNVVLAALEVKNAANISFSVGSVGVPQASTGATGLGALSGAGAVATEATQLASAATSGLASERAAEAAKMIEDILMKWLEVKVIEFSEIETREE